MTGWAEAALFAAARAELVERVIRPALERGADVVCDRYVDSSLAYQGLARGLGLDEVLELNLAATGGLLPDLTFLAAASIPRRPRGASTAGPTGSSARDPGSVRRSTRRTASSPSASRARIVTLDAGASARRRSPRVVQ